MTTMIVDNDNNKITNSSNNLLLELCDKYDNNKRNTKIKYKISKLKCYSGKRLCDVHGYWIDTDGIVYYSVKWVKRYSMDDRNIIIYKNKYIKCPTVMVSGVYWFSNPIPMCIGQLIYPIALSVLSTFDDTMESKIRNTGKYNIVHVDGNNANCSIRNIKYVL